MDIQGKIRSVKKGITLLEILIVLGIFALVAGVGMVSALASRSEATLKNAKAGMDEKERLRAKSIMDAPLSIKDGKASFLMTSDALDRQGEVVEMDGWRRAMTLVATSSRTRYGRWILYHILR